MNKNRVGILIVVFMVMAVLGGCKKAPEVSDDREMKHAQSSEEKEIQKIVEEGKGQENIAPGELVQCSIGTKENGIKIDAKLPAVPEQVYQITLCASDRLNKNVLETLLDSKNGNIKDVTKECLKEEEKENSSQSREDSEFLISSFGDGTFMKLTDGEKEVFLQGNTSVHYSDIALNENCQKIYKSAKETKISPTKMEYGEKFSANNAKEALLEKLKAVGIKEVHLYEITCYESRDVMFYEMKFTPSYEGMGIASEFGQVSYGEVFPMGQAWITQDGVADMDLENFCGKIQEKKKQSSILHISQIKKILEKYLENQTVQGSEQMKLTDMEFVYYPILKDTELELVPVWHIYIPMEKWNETKNEEFISKGAAWNIYLNAVNGKLEKVE